MSESSGAMSLVRDLGGRWPSPKHMVGRLRKVLGAQPLEVFGSWPIRQSYHMDGGDIVGTGPVTNHVYPAEASELLQEFMRLFSAFDTASEAGMILSFCQRWGHLGHSELLIANDTGTDAAAITSGLGEPGTGTDPVGWVKDHVVAAYLASTLLAVVKNEPDANLIDALAQIPRPLVFPAGSDYFSWHYLDDPQLGPEGTRKLLLSAATQLIGPNVAGIHIVPQVDDEAMQVGTTLRFTALIEVIWWHVLKLAESPKLRVCQECRSVFAPKRTNQVYCPPPAYSRGEESLCAVRQRMRSYRNKKSGVESK